jgi:hypothetical protein
MNFRRTRNKRHLMAMTHLAVVADRIGRSYSPSGGREERDLVIGSKNLERETASAGLYCSRARASSLSCMDNIIRFPMRSATKFTHLFYNPRAVSGNPYARLSLLGSH